MNGHFSGSGILDTMIFSGNSVRGTQLVECTFVETSKYDDSWKEWIGESLFVETC